MDLVKKNIIFICLVRMLSSLASSIMFVSLALFLSDSSGSNELNASVITGIYFALNYGAPIIIGYIGNHFISFKKLYIPSLIIQSAGYIALSLSEHSSNLMPVSLALILIGSFANSVCIVEFLSCSTEKKPEYRRPAMIFNYAAMNIGFIIGTFASGIFSLFQEFNLLLAILGAVPLICAFVTHKFIQYNSAPTHPSKRPNLTFLGISTILIFLSICALTYPEKSHTALLYFTSISILAILAYTFLKREKAQRKQTVLFTAYLGLWIIFWAVFLLTPITLMNFMQNWVNLQWGQLTLQPQWLDIADPVIVVVFTPLLAILIKHFKQRFNTPLPTYLIFSASLILTSLASYFFATQISIANTGVKINPVVILTYIGMLAFSELLIAGEGYTLPAKLAPRQLRGIFIGVWVSSMGISSLISSSITSRIFDGKQEATINSYHTSFKEISLALITIASITLAIGITSFLLKKHKKIQT